MTTAIEDRRPRRHRLAALAAVVALGACASPVPNRDPVGQAFPQVQGESLAGEAMTLPDDLAGAPAILLVGYVQEAQFDLDRWLLGLLDSGTPVRLLEVPTIPGLVPGLFSDSIDAGMREGIPSEDWSLVVTVYGDGDAIVDLTGNTSPRNTRVLLLDADGVVRWFHDRGYSARVMLELDERARALADVSP
jgi:hypothetical protein